MPSLKRWALAAIATAVAAPVLSPILWQGVYKAFENGRDFGAAFKAAAIVVMFAFIIGFVPAVLGTLTGLALVRLAHRRLFNLPTVGWALAGLVLGWASLFAFQMLPYDAQNPHQVAARVLETAFFGGGVPGALAAALFRRLLLGTWGAFQGQPMASK